MVNMNKDDYLIVFVTIMVLVVAVYGTSFLMINYQQEYMMGILLIGSGMMLGVIGMLWGSYKHFIDKGGIDEDTQK